MKRLPIDIEGRLKSISDQLNLLESISNIIFSKEDIELIANEKRICYICDSPTFQITYILDGGTVDNKNYMVGQMSFNSSFFKNLQEKYSNGEVYIFYSLNNGIIRGCFIEDFDDIISKDRDDRITEVLK